MAIDFHKSEKDFKLGIWRMDEPLEELYRLFTLSHHDFTTLRSFSSEYRKREWLTTRVLVSRLLSSSEINIVYNDHGKPFLVNSRYSISISHTKNFVAVLLSEHGTVGIDIETIQPRIEKIARKFVTEQEENFIEPEKKIIYEHVIWGTKEVLFKIYSKGELNFLENLHLKKFQLEEAGMLTGVIMKDAYYKEYRVFYQTINNLMLVYALG